MRQNPNNLPDRVKGKKPERKKPEPYFSEAFLSELEWVDAHLWNLLRLDELIEEGNLLARKAERLPDFNILGGHKDRGDTAEKVEFESFINQHYPRKKFAELWRRLGLEPGWGSKTTTPDQLFRSFFKTHELLQSIVTVGNWVAEATNTKRPALQICTGCGRFFLARRKDAQTCSPKCSARARMARARAKAKDYEVTRAKNASAKDFEQSQKRKLKGTA